MKYSIIISLFIASTAYTQSGEQLLQQSAQKISELKSITYNTYAEQFGEKVTADVTISRKQSFPIFDVSQVKFTGLAMNDQGSRQISFASDGKLFEYFDTKSNAVSRMEDPNDNKLGRTGLTGYMLLVLPPYIQQHPFEHVFKILKQADKLEDTAIYNVPCYKLKLTIENTHAVLGTMRSEVNWYLGKDDLLIRGISSTFVKQFIKIKNINQQYDDAYFRLAPNAEVKKVTGLEPATEGLLAVGTAAPDWTLPTPGGKITLSKLKGKVVLLDFWGTWCVPCIKAMPHIQAIHDHFKGKNVEVIGVSVETESTDPAGFMKRKGFTYQLALDGHSITKPYKVSIFPSVYIIDKDGKIIHAEYGSSRENFKQDIIDRIQKALN